jgi:hypothetical protein
MKLFGPYKKRSRTASMQLSINAIVILVMAIAILGLGLGIIRKIVSKYNGNIEIEIFNELFYQVKIEIPKHTL